MVSPPSSENGSDSPKERSPVALPEGTQLRDQYQIGEVLGVGNFGITYQARDEHLDTTVAIKEYYPRQIAGRTDESQVVEPYSTEEEEDFEFGRQRFLGEGRILARFEHDNIVRVRSYFEANGTGYLVMDYYEGQTLDDYLAQNGGSLSESESVDIIQSVLDGLEPVHDEGLLHRDIDPQNIYRRSSGEIVLLDFGAARVAMGERSKSLSVILKPGYAPYEQYHSEGNQGPWTDVYACAATLYKCITGLKPPEALSRIKEDKLTAPHEVRSSVSLEVSMAIMKGLAVRPEQRPGTAEEFSSLLGGTLTAEEPNTSTQTTGVTRRPDEESFEPALEEKPEQAVDEQSEDAEVEGHHNLLSFSQTKIQAVALVLVGLATVALLWGAFGGASSGSDSEDQSGLGVTPEWRNRVEMLVGVKSLPQAFLDSLITTVKRRENPTLYRTPDKRRPATLKRLRSSLSEDGIPFTVSQPGVTHAFVEYEVRSYGSAVAERFVSLHLIHRPSSGREDVDVLYLDTESELLGGLLKKEGPQLANRPDHETFRRELSLASILLRGAFTRLSWQQPGQLAITALGELGGVTVREGGKSEPIRRLQRRVLDAVYESDVRYVLE